MRKILVSVLSVAGLLAVVLALATSPASAARSVVTINTDADATSIAGVYTVSWETAGGCDPGSATSGGSGSVTLTVTAATTPRVQMYFLRPFRTVVTRLTLGMVSRTSSPWTGDTEREFVTVNDDCTYKWSASFIDAASKASCEVGDLPDPNSETAAIANDTPATIEPRYRRSRYCRHDLRPGRPDHCGGGRHLLRPPDLTQWTIRLTDGVDESADAIPPESDGVSAGAIRATTFVVTATPVPNSEDVCQPASAETSVNRSRQTEAKLFVTGDQAIIDGDLDIVDCEYDVTVVLPDGFDGGSSETNKKKNVAPNPVATPDVTVVVATRNVYLVQNVDGDSGGAFATYRLSTAAAPVESGRKVARCVPGLPSPLYPSSTGGIVTTTIVELREGRFNIGEAVTALAGRPAFAMDSKAVPCYAGSTVKNLPDHCTSESPNNTVARSLVTDADGDHNVLVEHIITCAEPAAEEPEVMEEPP